MITRMFGGTLCGIVIGALPISVLAGNPSVVHEVKHDRSQPLRDLAALTASSPPTRHVASFAQATGLAIVGPEIDTVAQIPSPTPMQATVLLNFDGLSAADTVGSGGPFVPPDPHRAVGASQFVEWVNVTFEVFDKATGAVVMGPTPGNAFWKGFGGTCETHNDGDIIIQYDKAAGRWIAAQPVFSSPFLYCVAVSTTSDATGSYARYR